MGRLSQIVSAKRGIRNRFEFAPLARDGVPLQIAKKLSRGASLRGQGTPADPARLRSERARNLSKTLTLQAVRISGVFGLRISRRLRTFESPCARRLRLLFPKIYFTFPRPRAGIRTARSRQPRRPLLLPAVRCAARAQGSVPGPVPPV